MFTHFSGTARHGTKGPVSWECFIYVSGFPSSSRRTLGVPVRQVPQNSWWLGRLWMGRTSCLLSSSPHQNISAFICLICWTWNMGIKFYFKICSSICDGDKTFALNVFSAGKVFKLTVKIFKLRQHEEKDAFNVKFPVNARHFFIGVLFQGCPQEIFLFLYLFICQFL